MSRILSMARLFSVGMTLGLVACAGAGAGANTADGLAASAVPVTAQSLAVAEPAAPAALPQNWREGYHLGTGDRVRIEVYREPDLSVEVQLDAAGSINYPLLGSIPAQGLTVQELERLITTRLSGDYLRNPNVRAYIVQFRPIYVIGAVRSSGAFAYTEGLTVERALALAGGATPQASTRRIFVLPEGGAVTSRERVRLDTPLKPGETILVEEGVF